MQGTLCLDDSWKIREASVLICLHVTHTFANPPTHTSHLRGPEAYWLLTHLHCRYTGSVRVKGEIPPLLWSARPCCTLSLRGNGEEVPLYSALHVFAPSSLITPWPKIYGYLSVDYLLKGTELDAISTTFVLLERGRELLQENNRIENRDTSVKLFTFSV